VIGKRFSLANLRGVGAEPRLNCDVLVGADLVRPDGADFLFAHALIQEAVYASTLKSRRRELHHAAACWFGAAEPVLRAEHLDRADDPGAAQAYLDAARLDAARFRLDAALRLAERGSEVATAAGLADTGCELALLRGEALREIGRSQESIAAFQSALALATQDPDRCRAWMGVAAGHRVTGDFDAAMQALNAAQPIAEQLGLAIECSRIHHTRGNLHFAQGQTADCEAQHALALEYAERSADVECQAQALSGLGDALYARGRTRSALPYFRRSVALSGGQIRISGPNRCMVGHCLWYENELAAAIGEGRSASDDAQRFGIVPAHMFAQVTLTQLLVEAGRFDEAEATCAQALTLARRAGSRRYESTMLLSGAELSIRRGDVTQAALDLGLALDLARQTGTGFIGAALHARLARVVAKPDGRAQALADGEALLKETGLAHCHFWFYRDAIEATLSAGEWPQAMRYADALEAFVRAEPLPWAALVVERARALAGVAQSSGDASAVARLVQVREAVAAAGFGWALAGIDAAPAGA
jgi:tetratricopeptide (TPR) repeat protein